MLYVQCVNDGVIILFRSGRYSQSREVLEAG